MEKKFKSLSVLFIISWIGMLALCVFIVSLKIQNLWLKDIIKNSEYSFAATNELLNGYKNSRLKEKLSEEKAVEYFEWQFMLKEEAKSAGSRLSSSIKLVKKERNKNELANLLYYNLGLNNMMILDFNNAAQAFEEALKYNKKDAQSCYNLALIYSVYFKNPRKAVEYYNRYLKIVPDGLGKDLIKDRVSQLNNALKLRKK